MRQIKEVLRLKEEHQLSVREIALSCGMAASTVGDYLKRAAVAGLKWPLPDTLSPIAGSAHGARSHTCEG